MELERSAREVMNDRTCRYKKSLFFKISGVNKNLNRFLFLISYRVLVRFLFAYAKNYKMKKRFVVIFGAADTGVATQRVLENDGQSNIQLLAFIDDDKKKGSKNLNGAPIITLNAFK